MKPVKLLITGSRGFIGSSVGHLASRAGREVLGLGLASQPVQGWLGSYVQTDVANSDLSGIIKNFEPDVVLHAAGRASVRASLASPLDDLKAAALTWANTLESVRRADMQPVILFPSSAAIYGNPTELPVREDAPVQPISPYGFHKAACELLAREYAECFGLRIIVCRLFSVFGPAQRRLLIWELYAQLSADTQTVTLHGTGEESRDYLHIDDVSGAFLELAETPFLLTGQARCLFVNVASGKAINVQDLAQRMRAMLAPEKEIQYRGIVTPGDPLAWCADIELLHSLAPQWTPTSLTQGLTRCIDVWKTENYGTLLL